MKYMIKSLNTNQYICKITKIRGLYEIWYIGEPTIFEDLDYCLEILKYLLVNSNSSEYMIIKICDGDSNE